MEEPMQSDRDDEFINHELRACGGDCYLCQQERAERREEQEAQAEPDAL